MSSDTTGKSPRITAEGSLLATVKHLWGYMWPEGRNDLRLRVVLAIGALLVSKVATTFVPFAYKGIIDGLNQAAGGNGLHVHWVRVTLARCRGRSGSKPRATASASTMG